MVSPVECSKPAISAVASPKLRVSETTVKRSPRSMSEAQTVREFAARAVQHEDDLVRLAQSREPGAVLRVQLRGIAVALADGDDHRNRRDRE